MPPVIENWDPNEWELYVYGLLRDRHGAANVMKVPARHKGDHGIDYYCLADRVAYQCYAVQEPCDVADRAAKQKIKITADVKKLKTNAAEIKNLFGLTQINRWVLVVPLHDSADVNKHLAKKTEEVRKCKLPFIQEDFEALINDLDSFDRGSVTARALQRKTVAIPAAPPTKDQVVEWTAASNSLVERVTEKMRKRTQNISESELNDVVTMAVEWFLERQNSLEALRDNAPELFETVSDLIARHSERVRLYGPQQSGAAGQILRDAVETLKEDLKANIPNFSDKSADLLALGTVSDWLMRCPLDFPPYSHA